MPEEDRSLASNCIGAPKRLPERELRLARLRPFHFAERVVLCPSRQVILHCLV